MATNACFEVISDKYKAYRTINYIKKIFAEINREVQNDPNRFTKKHLCIRPIYQRNSFLYKVLSGHFSPKCTALYVACH
jgi:hypothetical protein